MENPVHRMTPRLAESYHHSRLEFLTDEEKIIDLANAAICTKLKTINYLFSEWWENVYRDRKSVQFVVDIINL
uniref:Uncharacterized protein n=1 Tax=Romanomermis culicivorax TaxID=13658 RepID=A0A915J8V6_ROMCU